MNLPIRVERGLVLAPITINGNGPYDFIIDTATNSTLLDKGLAQKLKISPSDKILLSSSDGERSLERSQVAVIALGPAVSRDTEVLLDALESLKGTFPTVKGILGQNVLLSNSYEIDYRKKVLRIGESCQRKSESIRLPFELLAGIPILKIRTENGTSIRLVADSGATNLLFFDHMPQGVELLYQAASQNSKLTSISGVKEISAFQVLKLRIGEVELHNVLLGLDTGKHLPADGLLPLNLFSRASINGKEHYLELSR